MWRLAGVYGPPKLLRDFKRIAVIRPGLKN